MASAVFHLHGVVSQPSCVDWLTLLHGAPGGPASRRLFAQPAFDPRAVLRSVVQGELRRRCEQQLGPAWVCNLDQCWVRRQSTRERALHAPHSWHQDGALRFDFAAHAGHPPPPDALLDMLTCWIALTPCGADAPGLELIDARPGALLAPEALTDVALRTRFDAQRFVRPLLAAGDALLFAGDVLHRTHGTAAMSNERTSIELRLFRGAALPARLQGERCLRLDGPP